MDGLQARINSFKKAKRVKNPNKPSSTIGLKWPHPKDFTERVSSQKHPVSNTIRSLTLDGESFTINKDLLSELNSYIDLGQINTLKLTRGKFEWDFFKCAPQFFKRLQHISLNLRTLRYTREQVENGSTASVKHFFLECSPLQTIRLWSWCKPLSGEP